MEWLASPHRFRPAFQLLQNVTYKMVTRRKSPNDSDSDNEEDGRRSTNPGIVAVTKADAAACSGLTSAPKGGSDSGASNVDDVGPSSDATNGEDLRHVSRSRPQTLGKPKIPPEASDSKSNDSVFDDYVELGSSQRREPATRGGSSSSVGSTDSVTRRGGPNGTVPFRKQSSLAGPSPNLPTSLDMLKRSCSAAPQRMPRSLRVDQFDKTLYRSVDETTSETQAREEQPTVGRISTRVVYDVDGHTLKLSLISTMLQQATLDVSALSAGANLMASTPSSASASPVAARQRVCVQVTLLPDRITKQSALQRSGGRCIHWKEDILFPLDAAVQLSDVCEKSLRIVLTEFDKTTQPFAVAESRIELRKLDLLRGEDVTSPLIKSSRLTASCGELLVSITHLPNAGRLNVDVLQARGLLKRAKGRNLDTYVKVMLSDTQGRCCKNKKTSVVRNCTEPQFNETFVFDTNAGRDAEAFFENHVISVYLYACSSALTERDEVIGRVMLGTSKYASGPVEKSRWEQLRLNKHVKEWYDLRQPARFGSDSDKHDRPLKPNKSSKAPLTGTVSLAS